jgi:hypothetical protein
MFIVVINHFNLFGGLKHRQSMTHTMCQVMPVTSIHKYDQLSWASVTWDTAHSFYRMDFFFLSGPCIKQQTLWILRDATMRQLYMCTDPVCQSLCSNNTCFKNKYIPVSVINMCVHKHSFLRFLLLYFATDSSSDCLQFFTSHLYWMLVWV